MSTFNIRIHPVVLFNVLDSFERRPADQQRVIGSLLGHSDKAGNVEVTNCFVVQHREADKEVAVDIEVAKELLELHRKVNPSEVLIGWFSTGKDEYSVNEYSVVIHDYYSRECNNPIHMTIDPTKSGINIKAYVSTPFGIPHKPNVQGTMFSPIKNITIDGGNYASEMIGLKACMLASGIPTGQPAAFNSEVEMVLAATKKCQDLIESIVKFIDSDILNSSGRSPIHNTNDIGRQLMLMIENIIPLKDEDDVFNTNLKDLLMVIYLSNLTKTQLMLNEKLNLW